MGSGRFLGGHLAAGRQRSNVRFGIFRESLVLIAAGDLRKRKTLNVQQIGVMDLLHSHNGHEEHVFWSWRVALGPKEVVASARRDNSLAASRHRRPLDCSLQAPVRSLRGVGTHWLALGNRVGTPFSVLFFNRKSSHKPRAFPNACSRIKRFMPRNHLHPKSTRDTCLAALRRSALWD